MNTVKQQKYYDAIDRILNGKPSHPELKDLASKGKLKLNNYSVEKEAGMSVGSLRRHPDIKALIKKGSISKSKADARKSNEVTEPELIEHYEQKLTKEKSERIKANKLKKEYQGEVERVTDAMKTQLAYHQNMMFAMFEKIPEDKRHSLFSAAIEPNAQEQGEGGLKGLRVVK